MIHDGSIGTGFASNNTVGNLHPWWTTIGGNSHISSSSTYGVFPNAIEIPTWARKYDGYIANAAFDMDYNPKFVVVLYVPNNTMGVSFTTLHMIGDDGNPLSMSDAMIKHIFSDQHLRDQIGDIKLGENGELRGCAGLLGMDLVYKLINMMLEMYSIWMDFPNESDFNVVKKLNNALLKYGRMQHEVECKGIENEIAVCRSEIEVRRKRIEKLENEMNTIYEEAADAMNILEQHGINPNERRNLKQNVDADIGAFTVDYDSSFNSSGFGQYLAASTTVDDDSSLSAYNCTCKG